MQNPPSVPNPPSTHTKTLKYLCSSFLPLPPCSLHRRHQISEIATATARLLLTLTLALTLTLTLTLTLALTLTLTLTLALTLTLTLARPFFLFLLALCTEDTRYQR